MSNQVAIDEINLMQELYNTPVLSEIEKDNKEGYIIILAFISNLLLTYKIIDEQLRLSTVERVKVYKQAKDLINQLFINQIKSETSKVAEILDNTVDSVKKFRFKQSKNAWNISDKDVQKIINATIEGKIYSDRIYDNKNKVAKVIKKQIKDLIDGKTSVNEIKDLVQKKFELNDYVTNRLVENEISRVCRELDEKYFLENDIIDLIYVGILDEKICDNCFSHDGEDYKTNDPKRPKLPLHIKCRCFYAIK